MDLEHVEAEGRIIPRPQVVQPRAAQRRQCPASLRVNQRAQLRDEGGQHFVGQRARGARAQVAFPFLDYEVGLVHQLVGQDRGREIGPLARWSVAPHQGREDVLEQPRAPRFGEQDPRASLGEPRLVHYPGRRIRDRLPQPREHPTEIQEHEVDADPCLERDLQSRVEVAKDVRIDPDRQPAIVEHDPRTPVAEDEPPGRGETKRGHLREIARHRSAPRRHAQVRSPDVVAEVETVKDRFAVSGPRVIAPVYVRVQGSRLKAQGSRHKAQAQGRLRVWARALLIHDTASPDRQRETL
jgi:hypothetical protein